MGFIGEIKYNFAFCVGQSYDGAAATASKQPGVTSIVENESLRHIIFAVNLSASAAVKVSSTGMQNAENVARKVVKR